MKKSILFLSSLMALCFCKSGIAQEVEFDEDFGIVMENGGNISVQINLSEPSESDVTVEVSLFGDFANAVNGVDFLFSDLTLTIPANMSHAAIEIPILDNAEANIDRLFVISLSNPVNADLDSRKEFVVYILDDENHAPVGANTLGLEFASSYVVDAEGSAEIVAYMKPAKRLYVMNSTRSRIEILDFGDPMNISTINSIDLSAYGSGATSVACNRTIVAATVDGDDNNPGSVVFMNKDGVILSSVTVGYLPDMLVFSPDNRKVLVANEGEPNSDYSFDPEGSVSVIDITGGVNNLDQNDVTTLNFNQFDDDINELRNAGVRIFGLNATVSKDLEPEYITISKNSKKAWVTLQENNAVAEIDLLNLEIVNILPLGVKDHSLAVNSIDVSDRNDSIFMSTWNIKGMYMPDAIASYQVAGVTYLVTANEGDQREYDGINEDVAVRSNSYVLDPVAFPDAALLKKNHLLGRLAVTPYSGDTDGDGDFDEIHAFGARSFSIWNSETGELVYDSGDDFERITAADPVYGSLFNASNNNNSFKNRSDNKGPEPEGVTVAKIDNEYYAFITLERTGGVMAYNITNPANPVFDGYRNNRSLGNTAGGDLGPEGIIYISAKDSPVDLGLVVIANEISSTISVYYANNDTKSNTNADMTNNGTSNEDSEITSIESGNFKSALVAYPNPVSQDQVFFSRPVSFNLFNIDGQLIMSEQNKAMLNTGILENGIYILKSDQGDVIRLIVE